MKHTGRFTQSLLLVTLLLMLGGGDVRYAASGISQSDMEIEKQLLADVKRAESSKSKDSSLATALDNLADFYKSNARYADAEQLYRRSLDIRKKAFGSKHLSVATSLNNLASVQQQQGKYNMAESLYWDAIKILDNLGGPEQPEMTRSLHALIALYRAQGKLDKAESLRSQIPIFYEIKGMVREGKYTSREGDYKVLIPSLLKPGARVRDEGDSTGHQVIFTDDLGAFYRIISLNNDKGEFSNEKIVAAFPHARDKQMLETTRGREMRFVDTEKEGAEVVVQSLKQNKGGKIETEVRRPDLVTANSVFEVNKRIYHVVAGVTIMANLFDEEQTDQQKEERASKGAKGKLEKFLAGLEILSKAK